MRRALVGVLSIMLVLGVVGCQAPVEKIAEEVAGGVIGGDVKVDGDSVTVETGDGAVTIDGGTDTLPEGFPSDFPVYDETRVESSSKIASGESTDFYVNLISDDAFTDVFDWYKAELVAEGWTIDSEVQVPDNEGASAMFTVKKGTVTGTITIRDTGSAIELGFIVIVK